MNKWQLLAYALPALPMAALTLPLYLFVPTFYAETLGLSLTGIGAALFAVRIFDAINDPLIGYYADKWRGRWGLRRSWLAYSTIPVIIAAFALFSPPQSAGLIYLTLAGLALSIGYTSIILPLSAWGAEMSDDYHEKTRIVGWRESAVLVGTLIAVSLPLAIGWENGTKPHGLTVLAILIAVLLPLFVALAIRNVPERAIAKQSSNSNQTFISAFGILKSNKQFRKLITAFLINGAANALPATLFLLFVSQRLADESARGPLLALYFASAICGIPIWVFLSKKFNKQRTWCFAMMLACCLFAPAFFLGAGDTFYFTMICFATGICLGADLVLPPSIQADVIEKDTNENGKSQAAFFFALWSLATKFSLAIAVGLAFPVLDWSGFDAETTANTTNQGLITLATLYALVPIGLKVIAISIMWNYRSNHKTQ